MILPSNSCPLIYPDNNASKFNVELQNPIYLDGSWEVAMLDFTFVYYPFAIYSKSKIEYVTEAVEKHDIIVTINNQTKSLSINSNPIVTLHDNNILTFNCDDPYDIIFEEVDIAHDFRLGFKSNRINNNIFMTAYRKFKNDDSIETVKIKVVCYIERNHTIKFNDESVLLELEDINKFFKENCSQLFQKFVLNFNVMFEFSLHANVKSVHFDKILVKTLGLEKETYTRQDSQNVFKAIVYPKIISYHHQMFIYSSIVEPVIVGDSKVPLLKSVWIEKHEADEVVQIVADNPMYLPISTSCINNIEINIRDDNGKLIRFPIDSKTHLTLHFRKNES